MSDHLSADLDSLRLCVKHDSKTICMQALRIQDLDSSLQVALKLLRAMAEGGVCVDRTRDHLAVSVGDGDMLLRPVQVLIFLPKVSSMDRFAITDAIQPPKENVDGNL
jgi:hypothetical protein